MIPQNRIERTWEGIFFLRILLLVIDLSFVNSSYLLVLGNFVILFRHVVSVLFTESNSAHVHGGVTK